MANCTEGAFDIEITGVFPSLKTDSASRNLQLKIVNSSPMGDIQMANFIKNLNPVSENPRFCVADFATLF